MANVIRARPWKEERGLFQELFGPSCAIEMTWKWERGVVISKAELSNMTQKLGGYSCAARARVEPLLCKTHVHELLVILLVSFFLCYVVLYIILYARLNISVLST